jgi:hypothetical protein
MAGSFVKPSGRPQPKNAEDIGRSMAGYGGDFDSDGIT